MSSKFVSFSGVFSRLIFLGFIAAFVYGFFGPGREETCEGIFKEGDWIANNLMCPGFSALQIMVAYTFVAFAIGLVVEGISCLKRKVDEKSAT